MQVAAGVDEFPLELQCYGFIDRADPTTKVTQQYVVYITSELLSF